MLELTVGAMAAGGGCVARAEDGRVVFVRHALPGERVLAEVTSETTSFLRADAVEILEASPDRVVAPCLHAGPGRCGGCDWQHISLPAQRQMKASLVAEQLRRLAGLDLEIEIEEVAGAPLGLAWRTRVNFAVDRSGRAGLRRHRSHDLELVGHCPIATDEVNAVDAPAITWRGARHVEVAASGDDGPPVISVETGRAQLAGRPPVPGGLVVNGRTKLRPDHLTFTVLGRRFEVGAGVFWQVHPGAAEVLSRCVLDGLAPRPGDHAVDLYAGAGLFTVALADAVGPTGSVVALERSGRACADASRNAGTRTHVAIHREDVSPQSVARRLGTPDLVVLDPARSGAGLPVMQALIDLDPAPRRIAYVSCDPASFARDLRLMTDAGWSMPTLRGFDLFPMTEHVELVAMLEPPSR
jgi:tRNA/tmRNA/rRNA uracil-C5-methylase (TrmA/RlmC/RlmD family)